MTAEVSRATRSANCSAARIHCSKTRSVRRDGHEHCRHAAAVVQKSPLVTIVDCAQGGQTMARWA